MRRLELLIKEVRQSSDTNDVNSITDYELQRYFNDGQRAIQAVIYKANNSADVFVKEYLKTLVSGQQRYDLPADIYARNSVVSVNIVRDMKVIQNLRRVAYREKETAFGYALLGSKFVLTSDPSTIASRKALLTYNYQLPSLSLRVDKIASVDSGAGTITLSAQYLEEFQERYEYISIVDKKGALVQDTDADGNIVPKMLFIDSFDPSTFTITVEGDLSNVTDEYYVVMGANATSNSLLPEECEPYLLSYVQRRVLGKIASNEIQTEGAFSAEEREELKTLFEDNVKDSLYPVIQDNYFLGY